MPRSAASLTTGRKAKALPAATRKLRMLDPQLALHLDATRPALPLGDLDAEELAVVKALRWGRLNARQVRDIAAEAGLPARRTQELIRRLIHDHGVPIGTAMEAPHGNFLIDSAAELEATVELLRERGISNLARAAKLKGTALRRYIADVQVSLDREDR